MDTQAENGHPLSPQWTLLRDLAVLQVKLLVDGFRDLVLLPASIIAALLSVMSGKNGKPGPQFYNLLVVGKQSEHWINLFGAADRVHGASIDDDRFPAEDIDEMVSRVESFVVDEYSKGGVTRQVKSQLDRALESLHKFASSKGRGSVDKE